MNPVIINRTKENTDFHVFCDNLIKICEYHQKQGRASAFAFLMYDFREPHISKILYDTDYWQTLDKVSGNYLTIFSLHDDYARLTMRDKLDYPKLRFSHDKVDDDSILDIKTAYKKIIDCFFDKSDFPSPSILFFQVYDNAINDYFVVSLKEKNVEAAFAEILRIIEESVFAISQITPENMENYSEIFKMIEINVDSAIWLSKTKRKISKAVGVINFLSVFK